MDRILLAPHGDVALAIRSDRGMLQLVEYAFWEHNPDHARISIHHWQAASILVLVWLAAYRSSRWLLRTPRALSGRCPTCGYNLRVTPTRCPECGTPATAKM